MRRWEWLSVGLACGVSLGCVAPDCDEGDPDCSVEDGSSSDQDDDDDRAPSEPEDVRATCETSQVGPRLLRRLTRAEFQATVEHIFPEIVDEWGGSKLSPDPASKLGFTTDAAVLVVGGPTAKELLKTAEGVAEIVVSDSVLPTVLPCAASADTACATEFVDNYGFKLFRRPLSEDDVQRYVDFYESVAGRSDFKTGLKWTLASMIQSPHAVYRREIGEGADEGHALTQYELASNLSYTFAGAPPDRALLDQAAAGALSDPAVRRAEAERLLDSGNARATVSAFFREWLGYEKVRGKSREDDPDFAGVISPLMVTETQSYLDYIVRNDLTIQDLMTADFTTVDSELASFYGLPSPDEPWEPVTRPAGQGVGILAHGSLMASTAHQAASSPTLRGLLFYERFLCNSRPHPPDIVPPIEETAPETASTTREKYEEHHSRGSCGSCHIHFEPFGYSLEQYDELGKYRDMETNENGTFPVDTTASTLLPGGDERDANSLEDLANLVDDTDHIENCVSGLMAAYMLSGAGDTHCLAEESRAAFAQGEISIRDFILDLAATPHFSTRR